MSALRTGDGQTSPLSSGDLIGTVAIVGFPNVGKSTLVNRLTGSRAAVVHETPGVTRDRKELICEWRNQRFRLIDTGGVDIAGEDQITRSIADQAREAVTEADLVLFVLDAQLGITPGDEEVAQILRESKKPVLVIANKIDDPKQEALALELHRLGLGDPIPISGLHGHGTGDLLDEMVDYLDAHGSATGSSFPRGRSALRSSAGRTSASRASSTSSSAASASSSARPRARRATRSTRCCSAATARSSSSTPRASDANGATGRESSTTASCARSKPRSARTSRSSSSTRRRASSTRTLPSRTSRARRTARR